MKRLGKVKAKAKPQTTADERAKFYFSSAWKKLRDFHRLTHPLCAMCENMQPGDLVHHIIPIEADWSRRLDPENLTTLCFSHHEQVHGRKRCQ